MLILIQLAIRRFTIFCNLKNYNKKSFSQPQIVSELLSYFFFFFKSTIFLRNFLFSFH